jgi:dethiobiotin synthetase
MAARKENRAVDFDGVIQFCQQQIAQSPGTLLIEGIGGVMVPLDPHHTVLDWMAALHIPVLLVTGSYLGSLSHTLTALDALQRRDLAIKALVVNETPGATVTLGDTLDTLSNFAGSVPIVALPRDPASDAFAQLAALL